MMATRSYFLLTPYFRFVSPFRASIQATVQLTLKALPLHGIPLTNRIQAVHLLINVLACDTWDIGI